MWKIFKKTTKTLQIIFDEFSCSKKRMRESWTLNFFKKFWNLKNSYGLKFGTKFQKLNKNLNKKTKNFNLWQNCVAITKQSALQSSENFHLFSNGFLNHEDF